MNMTLIRLFPLLLTIGFMGSGCAAFRASTSDVSVDESRHMNADYDYSDMRKISDQVSGELVNSPFLARFSEAPLLMVAGVENRTSEYVDTKGLTDKIRTALFRSGKARFINEARREDLLKEQGYQAAHVTPGQNVAIGRQLGARFMVSGSLMEMKNTSPRQVRVSKQKLNYYKLTIEVTDLQSGELAWTTEAEFARQASLPMIGW